MTRPPYATMWLALALLACAPAREVALHAPAAPAMAAADAVHRAFPPPGAAVGIVARGRPPEFRLLGTERAGDERPVTAATVFQIASLTKPFTAIVVLRLAEQGRLGLDDRASRWLDWLPAAYHQVTLRQLLAHTSGVPRDLRRENVDEFTIEEFRRRFLAAEPSFAPGSRWEYSNTGYILLSLVAERAAGRSFGLLLDDLVFRPLAMRRTRYRAPLADSPGRAVGHDWADGAWRSAPPVHSGFGNSGIETTAGDLARFAEALQRRRLLRAESYAAMLAPATLATGASVEFPFRGLQASYGLGWFLAELCGRRVALHGGTIAGFSASLFWDVDGGVSTLALANGKSGPDRIGVADRIAEAATRGALGCGG